MPEQENNLEITCSNGEVTISQGNRILKMETSSFIDIINESQKDRIYMDKDGNKLKTPDKYFV